MRQPFATSSTLSSMVWYVVQVLTLEEVLLVPGSPGAWVGRNTDSIYKRLGARDPRRPPTLLLVDARDPGGPSGPDWPPNALSLGTRNPRVAWVWSRHT